jgi:protein-tyrosine sulfotransferase
MFNFSVRSFLWFLSIALFFWLLVNIYKLNSCSSYRKQKAREKELLLEQQRQVAQAVHNENTFYNANSDRQAQAAALYPVQRSALVPSTPKPRVFAYNSQLPVVFIVGIVGSGLELMGSLLGQSPYVRCSKETVLIETLIQRRHEWSNSRIEKERLMHAGMSDEIIDAAVLAFLMEIVLKQEKIANRMCNVDPNLFFHGAYVHKLLPRAKFVLMIRDARATVSTITQRGHEMRGTGSKDPKEMLTAWNRNMELFAETCRKLGNKVCKPVFYEQLVLDVNRTMRGVYEFVDVADVSLRMTDKGVIFPSDSLKTHTNNTDRLVIRRERVETWFDDFPVALMPHVSSFAPVMSKFGYDTSGIAPSVKSYFNLKFE